MPKYMKVALIHEYLTAIGGAEKVLLALLEIFPEADIFTSIYNPKIIRFPKKNKVYTSFIQNLPLAKSKRQLYLALMPKAFESFDLSSYDLVISDSHSFAKGVKTHPQTLHVCYCHTPTRYLWLDTEKHIQESSYHPIIKKIIPKTIERLKLWDLAAAQKPQKIIANSEVVAKRIKKIYQRCAQVIYPPVNVEDFKISKKVGNYYLIVSRFEPYKKIDLAIKAFNQLNKKLIIVGGGTEEKKLKKIAGKNIFFTGVVSENRLKRYYQNAKALIFPQEEDFGITAVEAQSSGRPVVAYNAGGAKETVISGKTGILFPQQTEKSLIEAIKKFGKINFNPQKIKKLSGKFSLKRFQNEIKSTIMDSYKDWLKFRGGKGVSV
jgi:glycosyltransferase involved in cell wall biosynthesis